MRSVRRFNFALLMMTMVAIIGCDPASDTTTVKKPKRPLAGDTVTPEILLGKRWEQNGPVLISSRLLVQKPSEKDPQFLQLEEIPYEIVPTVTLTFLNGDEEIDKVIDYPLTRDC